MDEIKSIAVIGTGLMGKGIAHVFASFGYKVDIFGRRDNVSEEIIKYFNNEEDKGRINSQKKKAILNNINVYNITTQAENLAGCNIIIETVAEDIDVKKEVFLLIKPYIKDDVIIASNTSSYLISKLAEFTPNPVNFIGMHFFSPVPMMKLVEVVKGKLSDENAINTAHSLVKSIEKLPITVKDSPAFILNRGLFVMINEAVIMLHEGIAISADDIDSIFIYGMGLKVGPLKLADMVGIDVAYKVLENLYEELKSDKYEPCILLKTMLEKGLLGRKSGKGFYCYAK